MVGACEVCEEKQDVFEGQCGKDSGGGINPCVTLDSGENAAVLGDG